MMKKLLFTLLLLTATVLAACGNNDVGKESNKSESKAGNPDAVLNIAYSTNLQTLDPHLTTNQSTRDVARQIFEQLLVLNENYEVVPSLAESYELSEDNLVYTFKLREGVKFHNGDTLDSGDVVASMEKWMKTSTQGKANLKGAKFEALDLLTVTLTLEEPSLIIPYVLADTAPFPAIVPAETVASSNETGLTEYIGTGPFQLEAWNVDENITLTRFKDYVSSEEPTSGLAGKKEAKVQKLVFHVVTDVSTRIAGLTTGEYDIAFSIPLDNAAQIEDTKGVKAIYDDAGTATYVFNKLQGPFADEKLRHAFNSAVNAEEALLTAYSSPDFFELDSSLALPSQADWYSQAGIEYYNQVDLEKAKNFVNESAYNGEEVVILATKDYPEHYSLAVVAQQVLQSIGVKAKIDVYDWPTVQERRKDPANFDIFPMTFAIRATVHQNPFLDSAAQYAGWTNDSKIDQLLKDITAQSSFEDARPIIDELQLRIWEYLPIVKLGNQKSMLAVSEAVEGYSSLIGPILWNVSKSE